MSKFAVRATLADGSSRIVELDRSLSGNQFSALQSKLSGQTLGYQQPSGTFVYVKTDKDLLSALQDAEKSRSRYVELTVVSGSGATHKPSAATSAPTPAAVTAPAPERAQLHIAPSAVPHHHEPLPQSVPQSAPVSSQDRDHSEPSSATHSRTSSSASSTPSSPPTSRGDNVTATTNENGETVLASFRLPASSTHADKIKVGATQSSDHYLFSCTASMYETEVDVILDGDKLLFKSRHEVEDDVARTVTTYRFTQTFQLPFVPNANDFTTVPTEDAGLAIRLDVNRRELTFGKY